MKMRISDSSVCQSRSLSRGGDSEAPRRRSKRTRLGAAIVLLTMCSAPFAFAQTTPHKKKKKPDAAAAASATDDTPAPAPPPPAPEPEPTPAPTAKDSATNDQDSKASSAAKPAGAWDSSDTTEDPQKKYYFVGLRYRGTVIPQFFENLFVDDGGTVYSNNIAVELDMRQDGRSMIPWIQYTDYGMGDTLFLTKGKSDVDPTQYSVVNSSLKALYLGLDEMWSAPLADHVDFEYGFGVGIGFVFGSLQNNWVYSAANGPYHSTSGGLTLAECPNVGMDPSCNPQNHQNSQDAKVGGYQEKNWFSGGSIPVVFPHISIPQLGIRYKPVKQLETRFQVGFSITGFWFGLSVDYGLEQPPESGDKPDKGDKGDSKDKPKGGDKGGDAADKGDKN